jgi:hypothetical protein
MTAFYSSFYPPEVDTGEKGSAAFTSAALSGYLTNENHTVAADVNGGSYSLTGAGGTFKVFNGTTDVTTSSTTFSIVGGTDLGTTWTQTKNGLTLTLNETTGVYSLSGTWTSDSESFILEALHATTTIQQVYSISKSKAGANGAPAKLLSVVATRQQVTYNGAGAITPASQDTVFTATRQNTTNTVAWTIFDLSGVAKTGLSVTSGDTTTLTAANFETARGATQGVRVVATVTDGTTLTDQITVIKVQDGTSAQTLTLTSNAQSITYNANGALNPSSQTVTFTANLQNVTGTATFVATAFNAAGTSLGTITLGGSGNSRTLTSTQFNTTATTQYVVVTATLGSLSDTTTIVKLADGVNNFVGYLTNENHTVATDSAGNNGLYSNAGGIFIVFRGLTQLTSGVTFSAVGTPAWVGIDAITGVFTISDPGSNIATVILRATITAVTPNVIIDQSYTITKARAGVNAKALTISSDRQTVVYNAAGTATPTTQTTTFTANKQNTTATVNWSITDSSGVARTPVTSFLSAATGDSVTMTEAQFASARNGTSGVIVTGTLTDGTTFTDRVSLVRIQEGQPGAPAQLLTLTSTSQAITFDGNGTANPASQTISFTAVLQNVTGTATFTATAFNAAGTSLGVITLGGSGNTRTLTNTQFTSFATTQYVTVTASLSGLSDTITTVRLADGLNNITGYLTNESVTLAASSTGVVSDFSTATGTFNIFRGLTAVTTGVTYSIVGTPANITGAINASTGAYSISAMSADTATITFRAVFAGVTIDKVFTASKSRVGATGVSARVATLTNEAHVVGTATNGTGGVYTNAGGTMRVFNGTSEITTGNGVVYSIFSRTPASPTWITIDSATGVYTVSDPDVQSATATLRAAVGGVNYDLVYSISKSLAGATGAQGPSLQLTASAQAFTYTDSVATPDNQTITFTAALQNLTGTPTWTTTPSVTLGGAATDLTRALTVANFGTNRQVTVEVTVAGVTDRITIVRLDNTNNTSQRVAVRQWAFNNQSLNGWSGIAQTGSAPTVTTGSEFVTFTANSTDTSFMSPDLIGVDGRVGRYLRMILSATTQLSATMRNLEVYFSTNAYAAIDGTRAKNGDWIPANHPTNGTTFEVLLDMHTLTAGGNAWRDEIVRRVRIDFDGVVPETIRIHEISIVYLGTATVGAPPGTFVGTQESTALVADAATAKANAATSLTELALIASDAWLTQGEKPAVRTDRDAILDEFPTIRDRADAFGVSRTTYATAYTDLIAYLGALSLDSATNTAIVAATFNTRFRDYYAARETVLDGVALVASQRANLITANSVVDSEFDKGTYAYRFALNTQAGPTLPVTGGVNLSADWSGIKNVMWGNVDTNGNLNGWQQSIPTDNGLPLWVIAATASATTTTDNIAAAEFSEPVLNTGKSVATIYLYQRATSPPTRPGSTLTYTFSNNSLTGTFSPWSRTIPSGTDPIYVIQATAVSTGTTDTIESSQWSSVQLYSASSSSALVYLYQRSTNAPASPTGIFTYTFSNTVLSQGGNWPSDGLTDPFTTRGVWIGGNIADQRAFGMPVKAGDRIYARCLLAPHRCTGQLYLLVYDKNGTLLEAPSFTGGRAGGGGGGNPANFDVVGGIHIVQNANAATAQLMWRMLSTSESQPYLFMAEPAMGILPSYQTTLPAYQTGRTDPLADSTRTTLPSLNRGEWASGVSYALGDIVTRNGSSYTAIIAHTSDTGNQPLGTNWALLANAGAQGATGVSAPPTKALGTGAAQFDPILLTAGQTVAVEAELYLNTGGNAGTCSLQVQWSVNAANSWTTMTNGSATSSLPTSEAVELIIPNATFTNTSGVDQLYDIRTTSTRQSRIVNQPPSFMRVK